MAYGAILGKSTTTYTNNQILSSSDATLLGLSSTATPSDMFNVLANVGDLYVWKRTTSSGTDYPVSTNRNAYQEGSDGQSAGYTLGEVQSGSFQLAGTDGTTATYYSASAVFVADNGVLSLASPNTVTAGTGYQDGELKSNFVGKFIKPDTRYGSAGTTFPENQIYFIPSDATISKNMSQNIVTVSKRQPVTGYAAIPVSTTIEYMGKLGDKARIVTGSYVGTGTCGSGNQNKLEFESEPKVVFISRDTVGQTMYGVSTFLQGVSGAITVTGGLSNAESSARNIAGGGVSVSWEGKTMKFYNALSSELQLNKSGTTYKYRAIL